MATVTVPLHPPGPPPMPVVGCRGNAIRFLLDPLAYTRVLRRYGKIVSLARGHPGWIFTFHPWYTRQLLTDPDLFHSNPFITAPPDSAFKRLTTGLLSMNGEQHRQQRKLIMSAFHRKAVETYCDAMVAITQHMLNGWQVGQRLDIAQAMQHLALQIASRALFGLDTAREAQQIGALVKQWLAAHESPLVFLLPHDRPGLPLRRLMNVSVQLEAMFRELIAAKRRNLDGQHDILATLIQTRDEQGGALTETELIGQVSILLIAGHETTSNALTWTLFLLDQHPHVLADLQDELHDLLRGAPPTAEQLAQLALLDRVIKESMRVLPPVCYSYRVSTAPFDLGSFRIGRGRGVFCSQYATHHDSALYAEPECFLPDRWLAIDPSPYEYLPFGPGPRMCIGATFALTEMKIVLAVLLQRCRLRLAPNARIDRRIKITLGPKHGMPMIVMPPDHAAPPERVRGTIKEMVDIP